MISVEKMTDEELARHALDILGRELGLRGLLAFCACTALAPVTTPSSETSGFRPPTCRSCQERWARTQLLELGRIDCFTAEPANLSRDEKRSAAGSLGLIIQPPSGTHHPADSLECVAVHTGEIAVQHLEFPLNFPGLSGQDGKRLHTRGKSGRGDEDIVSALRKHQLEVTVDVSMGQKSYVLLGWCIPPKSEDARISYRCTHDIDNMPADLSALRLLR
jgi:hypothetical protein